MIQLAITISLITLGFRAITGKNMILYFLRKWIDDLAVYNTEIKEEIAGMVGYCDMSRLNGKTLGNHRKDIKRNDVILFAMKPLITCSTCLASVHTLIWYPIFAGFEWQIIPTMLIVAILNTFGWLIIEKLQKYTK